MPHFAQPLKYQKTERYPVETQEQHHHTYSSQKQPGNPVHTAASALSLQDVHPYLTRSSSCRSASEFGHPSPPCVCTAQADSLCSGTDEVHTSCNMSVVVTALQSDEASPGCTSCTGNEEPQFIHEDFKHAGESLREGKGYQAEQHLEKNVENFDSEDKLEETGNADLPVIDFCDIYSEHFENNGARSMTPKQECRKVTDKTDERIEHINQILADVQHNINWEKMFARSTSGRLYISLDSLQRKFTPTSVATKTRETGSLDDASWKFRNERQSADNLTESQEIPRRMRERSSTIDDRKLAPVIYHKQTHLRRGSPATITPSNTISKSYNDLSGRHHVWCKHQRNCAQSGYSYPYCPGCLEKCYLYKKENKSSSQLHRVDDNTYRKQNHLLLNRSTFQGARKMRSVSADDVRLRSVPEDIMWKDGKVQLRNGGLPDSESVRYVWKDGHVEKITIDTNNVRFYVIPS